MTAAATLPGALRRYWGYESFRPMQERIVSSLIAGRDVCVIMPTGGGKSLCYQLPAALAADRTVLVVSPLIALMQDQVAQLNHMGIPAGLLNSSLNRSEQSQVMLRATRGEYRLLYLSPERLALAETIEWLRRVPLQFFVIDEAHCISEWGHEFRPDYRQLSSLRAHFPDRPIAAFTASATRRVRHDIIEQLQLRDPGKFIASFHRPNLRSVVRECSGESQREMLLQALRSLPEGNAIVYAPTIARVGETVLLLQENGFDAVAYHGRMDHEARKQNQERWMSDEVRILVGTVAFGLGINKPAVRAVIHLSLPKSVEQYYQEAGRAGRDGLAADCVLLWQKRDAGLLAHFIEQMDDAAEKEASWQRYHQVRRFVESGECRHRQICLHFGETPKWTSCGACDACGYVPAWLGTDSRTTKTRRKRAKSAGVESRGIPPAGAVATQDRRSRTVAVAKAASATGSGSVDPELRERFRDWRRAMAKQKNVPAFLVMHDTAMEELCRRKPASVRELREVPGFGEKKTETYGPAILQVLAEYRRDVLPAAPRAGKR